MNLQQLMDACPNLTVVSVGDKPAPVATVGLTPDHVFTLTAFARDTGHFRCTNAQATALADACKAVLEAQAAVAELVSAAKAALFVLTIVNQRDPGTNETGAIAGLDAALAKFGGAA